VTGLLKRLDFGAQINAHVIELDRDSEIDPNFAHGFTQIGERTVRIRKSIRAAGSCI